LEALLDRRSATAIESDVARPGWPRVAVIGGGVSGIGAGYYLRRAGIGRFTIFEASPYFGGTWHDNRYPGVRIDTPSHLYTYTFSRFDWSCSYASGAEICRYLEKTVDEFDLRKHFRFNCRVASVEWCDAECSYIVKFADGTAEVFDVVLSCVGFLNVPYVPEWVNVDAFPGRVVHTSNWPADLKLDALNVGVVGTGSSAVQVVAEAAKVAKNVTVFQRAPNWVFPKNNRNFTLEERGKLSSRLGYWLKFAHEYYKYEKVKIFGKQEQPGTKTNLKMRGIAEAHLKRALSTRPDLIRVLTPDFPFYGKRPIINDEYYPALCEPNVKLAPTAVKADAGGVRDAKGEQHNLDVLVLATGFKAANYLARIQVKGEKGIELHDFWKGEPAAYLGSCAPGFPNFFMMYGPNSNAGPVIFMLECQIKFAIDNIVDMKRRRARKVEVSRHAFDRYNDWLQARLETSVFKSAKNYFSSDSGKIVTQWPFSATRFWWISRIDRRRAMELSKPF